MGHPNFFGVLDCGFQLEIYISVITDPETLGDLLLFVHLSSADMESC